MLHGLRILSNNLLAILHEGRIFFLADDVFYWEKTNRIEGQNQDEAHEETDFKSSR